ncbi:hypothetical protein DSM104329_00868 [Capillimicrobium parvum]|uniref:Calcium-binding protein n=2 Tax=Capillimicrobium parvum TaxID=2884022 RepID=A0A9E6XU28_9ACTN|nr:hypothetical protein DSM104329_00868 [Capillimicrobium parvum]
MAGVVVAALLASAPAVAGAATAKIRNGTLTYTAAPGEANVLSVKFASGAFVLSDSGALITPGTGCTARAPAHLVTCSAVDLDGIGAALGDGGDALKVDASVPLGVAALGGAGDDVLRGGPQADSLSGGPGADRLDGAAGADVLRGGDDVDTADYSTRTQAVGVTLDAVAGDGEAGEGDLVDSTVENVTGGAGPDVLVGDAHANRLLGGGGDDTLQGMGGADVLDGGGGGNTATYRERTGPVVASLDDVANDGAPGEKDLLTRVQNLVGGTGADTLTGSANANRLDGGPGADRLDALAGPDTVRGGTGSDVVLLGTGNDAFDWLPGDSSDVVEGQGDNDTLRFSGANIGEHFDLSANGGRLRLLRDVGNVSMDVGGVEQVDLRAAGGADAIAVHDLAGTNVKSVRLDLAAGGMPDAGDGQPDVVDVAGTNGIDAIAVGTAGDETVVSGLPAPVAVAHADDPGDVLRVDGAGGSDAVVADSAPMPVAVLGGDGTDTVTALGTGGPDAFTLSPQAPEVLVSRTDLRLSVQAERLAVQGLGGDDSILAGNGIAGLGIALTLDGAAGSDTIQGSDGADTILGGDDADTIRGGRGGDLALLGAGDDSFGWAPGDGSDTVEGQAGADTLRFDGANIAEIIDLSANGGRLRLTRNVASVVMDVDGAERIDVHALGGADALSVHDLTGTAVTDATFDLAAFGTTMGDGQADTVNVDATQGADVATVAGDASGVAVAGLASRVSIVGQEAALDTLAVRLLAGDDVLDASGLAADGIRLSGAGGDGDDVLIGSAGADALFGDAGDDVLIGGPGNDALDGGPGDNIVIQD